MQIITIDDQDFPHLLEAFEHSKEIGVYMRDGQVQVVRANNQLVMVSRGESDPEKIAIKPARGLGEAEQIAKRVLELEAQRGAKVEMHGETAA